MKIQSLSFATPLRNNFNNIAFGNKQQLTNLADLKDVFEKMPAPQEEIQEPVLNETKPQIRYYYLGKDENAHETTAPFVTKQTEFGDRLYIIRKGKPRAFAGFTVEKNGKKEKMIMYKSGYPHIVKEYEDDVELKTTMYNTDLHKIQSIEKGNFKIEQNLFDDNFSIELKYQDESGNNNDVILNISENCNNLNYAEVTVWESDDFNSKNASIFWNDLDEVPEKLKDLDKDTLKMFYDNFKNLSSTIQSSEYIKDFGSNSKFNHSLEKLVKYIGKQI